MNIKIIKKGNIFHSNTNFLVNPVNTVGVMGAGLAKQFKEKFPKYFEDYKDACNKNNLNIDNVYNYYNEDKNIYIISFPTKEHYKDKSDITKITHKLFKLATNINQKNKPYDKLNSIAFPMLGCGLGGIDKIDMLFNMTNVFIESIDRDILIEIYYGFNK